MNCLKSLIIKILITISPLSLCIESSLSQSIEYNYPPGISIYVEFPDLPRCLHSRIFEDSADPAFSVYLPENYTSDKNYPLILWLNGGPGGMGRNTSISQQITNRSDFICVNFPLFKDSLEALESDSSNYWSRIGISYDDSDVIWNAYKIMLEKLYEILPNIDRNNTFLGGFSNGGHTTAVLLNRPGPEILKHFNKFFFIEGGRRLNDFSVLKDHPVIIFQGGC